MFSISAQFKDCSDSWLPKCLAMTFVLLLVLFRTSPAVGQNMEDVISRSPTTPVLWQWVPIAGSPLQSVIDAKRSLMYLALKENGVEILQLNNPHPPKSIAKVPSLFFAELDAVAIAQKGNFLYVALGDIFAHRYAKAGLVTIDVSNPVRPRVISLWQSPQHTGGSSSLLIDADHLYLGAMTAGVFIFHIAESGKPELVSSFQPNPDFPVPNPNRVRRPNVRAMALHNQHLFVCYDSGGLRIIDLSDLTTPREIGCYLNQKLIGQQQAYNGIALFPPFAYLTCDYAGVEVVDVSNLKSIRQVAWWDPWRKASGRNFWFGSHGHANQIQMDLRTQRLYVSAGDCELIVLDVSDPVNPTIYAHYGEPGDNAGAWGVTFDRGVAYLSCIRAIVPFHSNFNGIKALDCRQ